MTRKPACAELRFDFAGVVLEFLADDQHPDLLGGQPQRKRPGKMLDQHAHEPLQRTQRGPMDHHRPMGLVVGADVFQGEPFGAGQVVVELHGAQLPFAAQAVGDQKSALGP